MLNGNKTVKLKPNKEVRTLGLGFLGFLAALLSLSFSAGPISISIHWGFVLPLMVAIAYGPLYGLASGLLGLGAFFPFLLWPDNGWPNVLTAALYILWYMYQGYFATKREQQPNRMNQAIVVFIPFLCFYALATVYGFPVLFRLNPPFWNPNAIDYVSPVMIRSIAAKEAVMMFVMLIVGNTLLRINFVRRLFGLPIRYEQNNNGRIFLLTGILGLLSWGVFKLFNAVFVDHTFPDQMKYFNSPYELSGLIVFMLVSITLASVYIEINEKQLMILRERIKLEKQLQYFATTDALTGVLNRRTGLLFLESTLKAAKRRETPVTICFIDINYLKKINDRFGHKEGDAMIVQVTTHLKEALRESDNICRFGGDEFLLVLADCSRADAQDVITRVQRELQEFNAAGIKPYEISISSGFAEYIPPADMAIEALIETADEEMYAMKVATRSFDKVKP